MAKKNKRPSTQSNFSAAPARPEFNPDYTLVKRDLKRIGALAAFFFAALIVLSFFIK